MRKRTVIYWIFTGIIFALVNLFVMSSNAYRSKTARIDGHIESLRKFADSTAGGLTIFIGNSYVRASMVKPPERDDLYVLTVSGMPLNDMAYVLEALPADIPVSRVVLGLGYDYATPVRSHSYMYRKYTGGNAVARAWWSLPVARAYSLSSTIVKQQVNCWRKGGGNSCSGDDEGEDRGGEKELDSDADLQRSVERRLGEYSPYVSTLSTDFSQQLTHLRELAAQRDITLLAYTAPIAPGLRADLPAQTLSDFRSAVERSGIPYVDLNLSFNDWNYTQFSDATHVRRATGGIKTTQALIEFMQNSGADIASAAP